MAAPWCCHLQDLSHRLLREGKEFTLEPRHRELLLDFSRFSITSAVPGPCDIHANDLPTCEPCDRSTLRDPSPSFGAPCSLHSCLDCVKLLHVSTLMQAIDTSVLAQFRLLPLTHDLMRWVFSEDGFLVYSTTKCLIQAIKAQTDQAEEIQPCLKELLHGFKKDCDGSSNSRRLGSVLLLCSELLKSCETVRSLLEEMLREHWADLQASVCTRRDRGHPVLHAWLSLWKEVLRTRPLWMLRNRWQKAAFLLELLRAATVPGYVKLKAVSVLGKLVEWEESLQSSSEATSETGDNSTSVPEMSTSVYEMSTSVPEMFTSVPEMSTSVPEMSTSVSQMSSSVSKISTSVSKMSTSGSEMDSKNQLSENLHNPVLESSAPECHACICELIAEWMEAVFIADMTSIESLSTSGFGWAQDSPDLKRPGPHQLRQKIGLLCLKAVSVGLAGDMLHNHHKVRWLDVVGVFVRHFSSNSRGPEPWGWVRELFSDQDDDWITALLAILQLNTYLQSHATDQRACSVAVLHTQVLSACNIHGCFRDLLAAVLYDHSVLVDLLASPETDFLLFLTRYLRLVRRRWGDFTAAHGLQSHGNRLQQTGLVGDSRTERPETIKPEHLDVSLGCDSTPTKPEHLEVSLGCDSTPTKPEHLEVSLGCDNTPTKPEYMEVSSGCDSMPSKPSSDVFPSSGPGGLHLREDVGLIGAPESSGNSPGLPVLSDIRRERSRGMEDAAAFNQQDLSPSSNTSQDMPPFPGAANALAYLAEYGCDSEESADADSSDPSPDVDPSHANCIEYLGITAESQKNMDIDVSPESEESELDRTMSTLIRLRFALEHLCDAGLFPYKVAPLTALIEQCENLYEGSARGNVQCD